MNNRSNHNINRVFPTLDGNRLPNLTDIATLIKTGSIKNIIVMAGAGISTSAGIPDFRSPDTGIYANLEKFKLPYPEAIFDIDYFKKNPTPFYTLAEEINPKKYKPTKTHEFFKLLEKKKMMKRCFTQNIDTLERLTGLSDYLIVEAHGSFATCHCLECRTEVTDDEFMRRLQQNPTPLVKCVEKSCVGKSTALVKPDIVFFGEQLPERFYESLSDFPEADLLIVLGTSLQVQPFASLITKVPRNCPRLLINLEPVGEIDRYNNPGGFDFKGVQRGGKKFIRDVLFLGTTDDGVEELCDLLGWKNELLDLYHGNHLEKVEETSQVGTERDNEEQKDIQDQDQQSDRNEEKLSDGHYGNGGQKISADEENAAEEKAPRKENTSEDEAHVESGPPSLDEQKNEVDQLASIVDELSLSKKL